MLINGHGSAAQKILRLIGPDRIDVFEVDGGHHGNLHGSPCIPAHTCCQRIEMRDIFILNALGIIQYHYDNNLNDKKKSYRPKKPFSTIWHESVNSFDIFIISPKRENTCTRGRTSSNSIGHGHLYWMDSAAGSLLSSLWKEHSVRWLVVGTSKNCYKFGTFSVSDFSSDPEVKPRSHTMLLCPWDD